MTTHLTVSPPLLAEVLDAHGGLERARGFTTVAADVVSGGFLWALKGIPLDAAPRRMTSGLRRPWTRTEPFGSVDWHMTYAPEGDANGAPHPRPSAYAAKFSGRYLHRGGHGCGRVRHGTENETVAPGPSLSAAQRRPW